MIEKYGSGIGRIINYFKEVYSPLPTFENHSSGFLVTAYAANNERSLENVTENVTEKRRQKIIKLE
jgi:ATP-dependent DNA helicase RecG